MNKFLTDLQARINIRDMFSLRANKILTSVIICTALSACSKNDIDDSIDDVEKNRTSDIYFVNALDVTATFYVKNELMVNDLYKSQFDRGDVESNAVSNTFEYDWNKQHDDTEFGVRDTNSSAKLAKQKHKLKDNRDFWSIAWRSEGNNPRNQLSVIEKRAADQNDVLSIRVFASSEMVIKVNNSNNVAAITEAGKVSSVFRIENCSTGLNIDKQFIDLCQGDFGKSYLLVVNENGLRVMAQE
ncbi:hypothetical protein HR060_11735 [Catenovulum sp. SM1970]|uniref:hypothetical protein n=1 Tax=Marinifaba aquimaris TaxID=2741323 RepID=UPI0015733237|nr:hypothetical protein [Marinifaba aquimaris]NTS77534.1 hypothetical protein [Marinifaba aquimaris]